MLEPLDEQLTSIMTHLFNIIRPAEKNLTDVELRCLIVATNLRGLAEAMLIANDRDNGIDLPKTALGLLGTADWLKGDLEPLTDKRVGLE